MKYTGAEVKSGIFIFIAILLFFGITFTVGQFMTGETQFRKVRFGYIAGLEEKAPVHYAGTQIGKVEKIEIVNGENRPVIVTIELDAAVVLREGTKAYVDMLGMLGEKFIELAPGSPDAPELSSSAVIDGVDPVPLHEMMRKMNYLADQMEVMMEEMNPMLKEANGFIGGHREDIARIIANTHEISANLRDMTTDLKHRPWRLVRKD
jgi:phospholipid/cholesterol/gamma-HCH transport system substrate-binding protein